MKNLATLSLFLLLAASALHAQKLATAKPEIALHTGFNYNRWDDSRGPSIGLTGFMPLAGRWGIAAGWQFGQNPQPDYYYVSDNRPLRFFTTDIGLARTNKRGNWRLAAGFSHQYLPKPVLAGHYHYVWDCVVGASEEQLDAYSRLVAQMKQLELSALSLFGGHLAGEFRWAMGKQMFGSVGATYHFLTPPNSTEFGSNFTAGMAELNFGIGLRR